MKKEIIILCQEEDIPDSCAGCKFIRYFKRQWYCICQDDIVAQGITAPIKRDVNCPYRPCPEGAKLIDANQFEVVKFNGTEGKPDKFDNGVGWMLEQIDKAQPIAET